MTIQKAGTELSYSITWLEMTVRPSFDWPHLPLGSTASLLKAKEPPAWYFLSLYDAVGRDYAWEDMFSWEEPRLKDWLQAESMTLYTLVEDGFPQGFFMLDDQGEGVVDLACDRLNDVDQRACGRSYIHNLHHKIKHRVFLDSRTWNIAEERERERESWTGFSKHAGTKPCM